MKALNRVYYLVPTTNSELEVLSHSRSHRVLKKHAKGNFTL